VSPYERILVGTDGSDSANRAVMYAANLGAALDAEVIVSHAFRPSGEEADLGTLRNVGASLLRDAATRHRSGATIRPVLREGEASEALVSLARQESSDLIVVGNRGLGRRRVQMGTVPAKVSHRAPCDVLIAHTTEAPVERGPRRMMICTDGSPTATRAAEAGGALARSLGAKPLLLHVGPPDRGAEVLARTAEALPGEVRTRTVEGDPAAEILAAAREEGVDLIVVGNKGMTGLRRFLASVPSRVARGAPSHVLLVKTT
jgi:nucleotide-binding universal stress UspA family protein